jgi:SAM-dependent methyltransferase
MIPLNQVYKEIKTLNENPKIKETYDSIFNLSVQNNFVRSPDNPKGRIYDDAILFNSEGVDFNNKIVCELGARDGIFSSWLTQYVKKVHTSDYFEEWGKGTDHDLGQISYWSDLWKQCAYFPDKMVIEHQDLTNLTYPDDMFDITTCTSVIEHTFNQAEWMGDMKAIREMVRITKPGGYILLSTDMGEITKWNSGTLYYSKVDLFDRLINPSKCELNGAYDFDLSGGDLTDIHHIDGIGKVSSVVFSLKKPKTN